MPDREMVRVKPCARMIFAFNDRPLLEIRAAERAAVALQASNDLERAVMDEVKSFVEGRKLPAAQYKCARDIEVDQVPGMGETQRFERASVGLYRRFRSLVFCPGGCEQLCQDTARLEFCEDAFVLGIKVSIGLELNEQPFGLNWNVHEGPFRDELIDETGARSFWGRSHWKVWFEVISTSASPDIDSRYNNRNNALLKALKEHRIADKVMQMIWNELPAELRPAQEPSKTDKPPCELVAVSALTCKRDWVFRRMHAAITDSGQMPDASDGRALQQLEGIALNLRELRNELALQMSGETRFFWCNLEEGLSGLFATSDSAQAGVLAIAGLCFIRDRQRLCLLGRDIVADDLDVSAIVSEALMRDFGRWY